MTEYKKWKKGGNMNEAVYGFGFIGALFYFIPQAHSFGPIIMAILKSIVWPAILVFHLLGFLKI